MRTVKIIAVTAIVSVIVTAALFGFYDAGRNRAETYTVPASWQIETPTPVPVQRGGNR